MFSIYISKKTYNFLILLIEKKNISINYFLNLKFLNYNNKYISIIFELIK